MITVDDIVAKPELISSLKQSEVLRDPELFSYVFLKIPDKVTQRFVPFHWNKMQKYRQAHRTRRDIILKYRQGGASTLEQAILYWSAVTSKASTLTLTHDDLSMTMFRQMGDSFYNNHPFAKPRRDLSNAILTTYPETESKVMIGKAGSVEIGRSTNLSHFVLDEFAFWENAKKILAGALQSGDPWATILSTPNGASGTFYEMCMEAMEGEGVWNFMFFPWWWEKQYRIPLEEGETLQYDDEEKELIAKNGLEPEQIKWRRYKKRELGVLFVQEYPEDAYTCFLVSGEGFFGNIEGIFTAPYNAEFDPTHKYRAGLDWGKASDYTELVILDKTTNMQVDGVRVRRMEWKDMRLEVQKCYNKWRKKRCSNGHITPDDKKSVCAECNTATEIVGLRYVTAEKNSVGDPNIEGLRDLGVVVREFQTDVNSKREIIYALREALHNEGLRLLNDPISRQEMNSFVNIQTPSGNWVSRAAKGAHDDFVMALAFANHDTPVQLFV